MKWINRLLNENFAKKAASLMKYICYLMMVVLFIGLVLSCIGWQTFILHIDGETYTEAIYAGGHHDNWWNFSENRRLVIVTSDEIRVFANEPVEVITHIGLSAIYAVNAIPILIGLGFLSRVFRNVSIGQIFIEQNAFYLLYYGLLGVITAMIVPFAKLGIAEFINLVGNNTINIATGQDSFNTLVPSIAFIVAAYIIYHGVQLQDEVDHTL